MYAVGRLGSYLSRSVYTVSGPFHPFGGAVDIVVVEQPDGSFKSSPWYVKFGKFQGVLKTKEKVVAISVNDVAANFHMYLNHKGEAYFLREVEVEEGEASLDPLSSLEEPDEPLVRDRRPMKSMSCKYEMEKRKTMEQFDADNGKIVARTTSRRSRILGFVFGRRSMKEDSFHDEGDGPGVVRVNSLERAELAADLLEMNWSTNLVSRNYRKDRSSLLSAPGCEKNAGDRDVLAADEQEIFVPSMSHNGERNIRNASLQNGTASCRNEQNRNSSGSEVQEQEFSEDAIVRLSSISSTEQESEAFQSAETILEEKQCDYPKSSGNGYHDEAANGGILTTCGLVRKNYFEEEGAFCSGSVTSNEDSVSNSVPSFAYNEASDNLVMRLGDSTEHTYEALDVFGGENKKGSPHVETLILGADPSSEGAFVKQAEEMELDIEEEITRPEEPYVMTRDNHQVGQIGDQAKTDRSIAGQIGDRGTNTSSPLSESSEEEQFLFSDLDECKLHRLDHINTSNGRTEEGKHQFTSINGCSYPPICQVVQDSQSTDVMIPNEHSKITQSPTRTLSSNIESCEKAPRKVDSMPDMLSPDAEVDAYDRHLFSHSLDSSSELIKMEFFCKDDYVVQDDQLADIKNCNRSSVVNSSPMYTLSSQSGILEREVESFPSVRSPHDKLDAYDHPQSNSTNSNLGTLKMEIYGSTDSVIRSDKSADSIESSSRKLRMTSNPRDILSSYNVGTEKPEQQSELLPDIWSPNSSSESVKTELCPETDSNIENHPLAYSNSYNGTSTSPISILSSHKVANEKSGRQVESLPNMLSSGVKLDAHGHHHLSHSLGSKNESTKMASSSKDESICQKQHAEENFQITVGRANSEEFLASWNLKDVHKHPAVEVSLCKHLLFERMGADAAAQAFDAEKLDSSKFEAMGSTILENDRLVVRICGRYFPWSSAAPIVLGMLAFRNQEIFEPKGMIPVDQHEVGQPKDVVSWRIWPFSFKKSQSQNNMPPDLTNARNDVGNVVDNTIVNEDVEKKLVERKKVKKMIRATTPTSEQLSTLNLKEGSNTVTFTFSTAMLGNQKVDARIYLWKWNARIVISDVDGTITKSDVLGQFMPLMGVDWSQTGVTHLFSGIRENGYHFLFLSARAISQAYITRQFLINLKQDGKALPDGPIVISPDGLFPSLYREVIRRAPHEFKIACLEDIKALFPPDCNPFYAGFGNRETDEISYLKVGIPKGKIFIINPKGEVVVNRHIHTKSYTSLHTLVNDMFPQMNTSEQEDFNSWNYWKLPPPLVEN